MQYFGQFFVGKMAERSKACDPSVRVEPLVCLILSGFSSQYCGVGSNPTLVKLFGDRR